VTADQDELATASSNSRSRARTHHVSTDANGSGLTVAYKQADIDDDRRTTESDDATIILPLGNTPWAGRETRDTDAEARNR
jgi:hypothetical protein